MTEAFTYAPIWLVLKNFVCLHYITSTSQDIWEKEVISWEIKEWLLRHYVDNTGQDSICKKKAMGFPEYLLSTPVEGRARLCPEVHELIWHRKDGLLPPKSFFHSQCAPLVFPHSRWTCASPTQSQFWEACLLNNKMGSNPLLLSKESLHCIGH